MNSLIPNSIFILACILIILPTIPVRWSFFAYLLITFVDLTTSDFASASSVGISNTIKTIILPTILLFRVRFVGIKHFLAKPGFYLWILLVGYVALASIWSPFPLSAIKQLGYFYAYTVLVIAFWVYFRVDRPNAYRAFPLAISFALLLAVIQTYFLGNKFGEYESRFTAFVSPQSFGLALPLSFALLLSIPETRKSKFTYFLLPFLMLASFISGSRTGTLAIVIILISALLLWSLSKKILDRTMLLIMSAVVFVFASVIGVIVIDYVSPTFLESNRTVQALTTILSDDPIEDVSTFRFRLKMTDAILNSISERLPEELLIGSGTSSVGEVVTLGYVYYRNYNVSNIDANRIAHNEFLRALYEWGIIGLVLFVFLLVLLFTTVILNFVQHSTYEALMTLVIFLVVLVYMMLDNILAASSSPVGVVIILAISRLIYISDFGTAHKLKPAGN